MNRESAVAFIQTHGNVIEKARLGVMRGDDALVAQALRALSAGQRPDGGWAPFWAPCAPSVDATCYALAQAEQMGLHREPFALRAAGFLAARQRSDGSFEEEAALAPLAPPWALPGDMKARVYLTANAAYWLQVVGGAPREVAKAVDWLDGIVLEDGRLPSFLHAHWLTAGLLFGAGRAAAAGRIMGFLCGRLEDLDAGNLAWLAVALRLAGVAADTELLVRARARLSTLQSGDGRWPGEDGEGQDVHTTLEALRALDAFGEERREA